MLLSALRRTLSLVLATLIAVPLPLTALAGTDPAVKCGASTLKALGKSCKADLGCQAKWVKSLAKDKDPRGIKLLSCLEKSRTKLAKAVAKAQAKAEKKGARCSVEAGRAAEQVDALGGGILVGMLTDWSSDSRDPVDNKQRSALLKAGGKVCGKALAGVAKQVAKPKPDGLEIRLGKAFISFARSADKAATKAEKKGGRRVDVEVLQAVVDDARRTAKDFVPQAQPAGEVFEVSSGDNHNCLMRTDGRIECWGDNASGQSSQPAKKFFAISAGGSHSCGIRESDDRAECWGDDTWGQISDVPSDELGFTISAGGQHTCALRFDNTVVCWGDNSSGQLTPPLASTQYTGVSAGRFHTCGVRLADARTECWGDNFWGQTSDPGSTFQFRKVAAGDQLSCGIETDSSLQCWGNSQIPPTGIFFDVTAGKDFGCAIDSNDFKAKCWGQQGPWRAPPDNETFSQISSGARHTCALRDNDPTVTCWGNDDRGQTSCAGVKGCTGAAAAPCRIENPGPIVGQAGRFTIARLPESDPDNDYRLIMPRVYLEELRKMGPEFAPIAQFVQAVDDFGFSCDGDDRVAVEFPAEAVEITTMLHELNVLGPLLDALIDEVVEPVKKWLIAKIGKFLIKTALKCLLRMIIFRQASQCV